MAMWAAFRLGTFGTSAASLIVCCMVVATTAFGLGPISEMAVESAVQRIQLQLFLGVAVLVPLIIAMIVEERPRLIHELENKNAELERYTYTVSHDLKAPLITIQGFLSQLEYDLKAGSHAEVEEDISELNNASNSMSELLRDLLELSKQGVIVNRNESFSLADIIDDIVATLPGKPAVSFKAPLSLPPILGDKDRLSIVVRNILDNAQKYSGNGEPTKIDVTIEPRTHDLLCRVSDNGIGIPREHLDTVFELFERLDPLAPGSGAGLAIVKRIIDAHGGKVWIESEGLNQGSTVAFTLPLDNTVSLTQHYSPGQPYTLHTAS